MLDYKIEIKDEILIRIKKPIAPQEQLDDLKSMKVDLDIHGFIDWVSWLPIDPQSEEWAYWEARAGHLDPLVEQQKTIKEMQQDRERLKAEIKELNKTIKEIKKEKEEIYNEYNTSSRVIALKKENEKLKHKLEAYEHHKKKGDGKNGGKRKNIL